MAEKKPAAEIWAMVKGVSRAEVVGEVDVGDEKVRTRDLPTSKPQKDTATRDVG